MEDKYSMQRFINSGNIADLLNDGKYTEIFNKIEYETDVFPYDFFELLLRANLLDNATVNGDKVTVTVNTEDAREGIAEAVTDYSDAEEIARSIMRGKNPFEYNVPTDWYDKYLPDEEIDDIALDEISNRINDFYNRDVMDYWDDVITYNALEDNDKSPFGKYKAEYKENPNGICNITCSVDAFIAALDKTYYAGSVFDSINKKGNGIMYGLLNNKIEKIHEPYDGWAGPVDFDEAYAKDIVEEVLDKYK